MALELDPEYLKTCYQFRIFHKGKEVITTGDDYIFDEGEMIEKRDLLQRDLPGSWVVVVIQWTGKKVIGND